MFIRLPSDRLKSFVVRHPVATYRLTFAISWTGVLLTIGGSAGMIGVTAQDNSLFPLTVLSMLLGPSVTAIALIGFLDGKVGCGSSEPGCAGGTWPLVGISWRSWRPLSWQRE